MSPYSPSLILSPVVVCSLCSARIGILAASKIKDGDRIKCPKCGPQQTYSVDSPSVGQWRFDPMSMQKKCPLCASLADAGAVAQYHMVTHYHCPVCGDFAMDRMSEVNLAGEARRHEDEFFCQKLSAIIREHDLLGLPPIAVWLLDEVLGQLPGYFVATAQELLAKWPEDVPDRLDRALMHLAQLSPTIGHGVTVSRKSGYPLLMAVDAAEAMSIGECLIQQKLVTGAIGSEGLAATLTPAGWQRVRELKQTKGSRENPAFAAMWFTDEMTEVYKAAIEPAVRACGFKVQRIDLAEHNEWIMDKMFAMIRVSPFLIADFTGHRHGVYFEAGIAKGREIPLMACCKAGQLKDAHFDTKQLNHIEWNTHEELRERLKNRILGTLGQGPYPPA